MTKERYKALLLRQIDTKNKLMAIQNEYIATSSGCYNYSEAGRTKKLQNLQNEYSRYQTEYLFINTILANVK